jgi:hypothetical protein
VQHKFRILTDLWGILDSFGKPLLVGVDVVHGDPVQGLIMITISTEEFHVMYAAA